MKNLLRGTEGSYCFLNKSLKCECIKGKCKHRSVDCNYTGVEESVALTLHNIRESNCGSI